MPVYEYQCEQCDRVSEALRRMSDADAPLTCEHCGHPRMQRKQSVFAAASSQGGSTGDVPLPMGCCPCGKPQSGCGM